MAEAGEVEGKCGLQKEDITNYLKTPLRKGDTWWVNKCLENARELKL